jgi:hypothetical protein
MSYLSLKKIKATPLATTFLEYPGFTMEFLIAIKADLV